MRSECCLRWVRAAAAVVLLLAACAARAELEVIALRYRSAEQVLPVLRPLLERGGALSGMNDQLVIRASRENIAELRRVLAAIDVAPRRLMISVRQDSGGGSAERGASLSGAADSSRAAGVVISGEAGGGMPRARGIEARAYDSHSSGEARLEQRIQALEGSPALIQVGQSVPVASRTVTRGPGGAIVAESTGYRDATAGFEVVARVAGDRVTLDIRPRRDALAAGGGIDVQRMASTAGGRLGEWIELGGVSQEESRQGGGVLAGSSALRQDVRRVWVKVEEVQ